MGSNDWIELNRDAETGIETIRAHFEGHAYDPHFHELPDRLHRTGRATVPLPQGTAQQHPGESFCSNPASCTMATPRLGRLLVLFLPALAGARAARLFEDAPGDCQPAFAKTLASEPELLAVIAEAFRALQSRDLRIVRRGRAGCVAGQAGATSGLAPAARQRSAHAAGGTAGTGLSARAHGAGHGHGRAGTGKRCRSLPPVAGVQGPRSASRRMPIWSSCAGRGTTAAGQRAATGAGGDDTGFRRPESYGPLVSPRLRPDPGALPQALLESSRPLNRQARSFGHPQPTEPIAMSPSPALTAPTKQRPPR